jgi:hypothetical protein
MTNKKFKEYVESFGFTEVQRNTFEKKYRVRESSDEDKAQITMIYKISKGVLYFKVRNLGKSSTIKKGSLQNITINASNELEGLKSTAKYRVAN